MHRYGDVEPNLQGRGHLNPNFTGDLCARSSITLRYLPIACTNSSTLRVETPAIHASWMTATSAFSTVFRGSRKPGKWAPLRIFGIFRFSVPNRVSRERSR